MKKSENYYVYTHSLAGKPISEETRLKMIASRMSYIEKIKNTSGAQ